MWIFKIFRLLEDEVFMTAFSFVLAVVFFFCADPVDGIPMINVAAFAFVGVVYLFIVLLLGSTVLNRCVFNKKILLLTVVAALVGTLLAWGGYALL